MPSRTFDPRPIVATVSDTVRNVKLTAEEREFFDSRENRELAFLMRTNRNRNFS